MTTATLDDLLPTRILEIEAGTEVVFAEPRFLSIEVAPDDGAPEARRIAGGFTALFREAGTFRFICIVSGYERAERVPGEVIVRPRPGGAALLDFRAARPGAPVQEVELGQAACHRAPRGAV